MYKRNNKRTGKGRVGFAASQGAASSEPAAVWAPDVLEPLLGALGVCEPCLRVCPVSCVCPGVRVWCGFEISRVPAPPVYSHRFLEVVEVCCLTPECFAEV